MEREICDVLVQCGAAAAGIIPGYICGVFPYAMGGKGGNISHYARGKDYHVWVKDSLERSCKALRLAYTEHDFMPFVDISPYDEVGIAAQAGLGVVGKNHLLITPEHGSFVFIGIIKTDMQVGTAHIIDGCINCGKCAELCPTKVLAAAEFEPKCCISDMTQRRGELTQAEKALIKHSGYIWGCDICQLVCPMNSVIKEDKNTVGIIKLLTLEDIDGLSDRQFRKKYQEYAFTFRGLAPLRRNLLIMEDENIR